MNNDINNNHKIQTMLINNYLKDMEKNTYLNDECSICHKKQNSDNNIPIFKYCTKCNTIICSKCIGIHTKDKNIIKHFFINNNERKVRCILHPQNKNIAYCIDCKIHLCDEWLKTRKHMMHRKNNISECTLTQQEINLHKKIIDLM